MSWEVSTCGRSYTPRLREQAAKPTIFKVGGSLFSWPGLPVWLADLLEHSGNKRVGLIVGGGPFADAVRQLDRVFQFSPAKSHALAIQAMTLSAQALRELLPTPLPIVTDRASSQDFWATGQSSVIINPQAFLESESEELPAGWHVTSDSIAAVIARRLNADRLVLIKSVGRNGPADVGEAVANGWLDSYFRNAAESLRVEWMNPREAAPC